jgi:DNA polymerase-3 subunit beta
MSTSVEIESKGGVLSVAIPSSQLIGLMKTFPDQPISFDIQEKPLEKVLAYSVKIKSPSGSFTLPGEDGESYPNLKSEHEISFKIVADTLVKGVEKTLFAVGGNGLKPMYCGINISFEDGKAIFTATNGNMLSTFSYTANIECYRSFIVPSKVLSLLLAAPKSDEIMVSLDDRSIRLQLSDDTVLKSLLIDERYVDYQSVIPRANENHLSIDRQQMLSALKRVIQLSNQITKSVKVSLDNSVCTISSEDTDLGQDACETILCEYDGVPIEIGLVGNIVIECLSKFDTADAHFYFSTPQRAVIIRDRFAPSDDVQNLMLTMPVMLANR